MAAAATFALMLMALTIVLVVGVGVILWAVFGKSPYKEACCGKCRYSVEGLEGMTCPECGSDLRRVGIFVPGMRRETRAATRATVLALVWTCVMAIAWITANTLVSNAVQGWMTMTGTTGLVGPDSDAYASINLSVSAEGPAGRGAAPEGDVILTMIGNDGRSAERTLSLETFREAEDHGASSVAIVREALLEMAGEIGAETDDRALRMEVESVSTTVASIARGNVMMNLAGFRSTTGGIITTVTPVRWPFIVTGLVALAVWGGGMAGIIVWGRKRRRTERERWGDAASIQRC